MSGKLSPRRTGVMRKQIVRLSFDMVFKEPTMKRRRGRGTKPCKMWMAMHYRSIRK